jgi:hypothetical protein
LEEPGIQKEPVAKQNPTKRKQQERGENGKKPFLSNVVPPNIDINWYEVF